MSKIVFLDFELANDVESSICQIGMYVYDNGNISEISQLIKPTPYEFNEYKSKYHNITHEMVKDSPTLLEFWPQITRFFKGEFIICAHSANNDINYLREFAKKFNIKDIKFDYICSQEALHLLFPNNIRHQMGLVKIADSLGLKFNTHDAISDAKVILKIIECLCGSVEAFEDLCKRHKYFYKSF